MNRESTNGDKAYVLDLCDDILGRASLRQHRFFFLRADTGRRIPVDAFYPGINLVVECRERRYSDGGPSLSRRPGGSGMFRGTQHMAYDERLRLELAKRGIRLVELYASDFAHDPRMRLLRHVEKDAAIIRARLTEARKQAISKRRIRGAGPGNTPASDIPGDERT